jgi:hypothetical protein
MGFAIYLSVYNVLVRFLSIPSPTPPKAEMRARVPTKIVIPLNPKRPQFVSCDAPGLYRTLAMMGPRIEAIPRQMPKEQNMREEVCEFVPATSRATALQTEQIPENAPNKILVVEDILTREREERGGDVHESKYFTQGIGVSPGEEGGDRTDESNDGDDRRVAHSITEDSYCDLSEH